MSPALAGRFLTTAPPGKPLIEVVDQLCSLDSRVGPEAGESLRKEQTQRSLFMCLKYWSRIESLFCQKYSTVYSNSANHYYETRTMPVLSKQD